MASWFDEFPCLRRELPKLELLPVAFSTNDVVKSQEFADWAAVLTDHQSAGRGRLGRTWVSAPGQGLALSFVAPVLSFRQQPWLSLAAGAALVSAARSLGIAGVELKWPNDCLVDERKLGGILCEARTDGRVVVGIGVNIDFAGMQPPSSGATALAEWAPVSHELVDKLLQKTVKFVRGFCEASEREGVILAHEAVSLLLSTLGREVSVLEVQGREWRGVAESLTEEGHLLVREHSTGDQRVIVASDVRHLRQ